LSVWDCHVGFWETGNSALPRFEFGFLSKTSGIRERLRSAAE
jgi:hypothetical protein